MQRTLRTVAALTGLALCLSISACGDGDDSPKADAGKDSRLGEARYDALEPVYTAAVPLDRFAGDGNLDAVKFRAASQPLLEACEALERDDALLGPIRRVCPIFAILTEQLAGFEGACKDETSCTSAVGDVRTTLASLQRFGRASDRAVGAADIASSCKDALRTPEVSYAAADGVDSAFGLLQRALKSGSEADLDDAQRRLDEVGDADDTPSGKDLLAKFRSGCD